MTFAAAEAPWHELHHAFGRADDMPRVLAAVSKSRGWKLRKRMEELWERVLHQGSIYSASPPAVQALIPMAASAHGSDRKLFYQVLAEFASSSRKAIRDNRAIPCCAGGDPEHGRAILAHLVKARDQFAADLACRDRDLRVLAAALVSCSADAGPEAASLVRNRFDIERDPAVRLELLKCLAPLSDAVADWPAFVAGALQRESDPALRFGLRHAQIRHLKSDVEDPAPRELIALFLAASAAGADADFAQLSEALQWLGPERELSGLVQVLEGSTDRDVAHRIALRLLCLVFEDERAGWEETTYRVLSDGGARRWASTRGLPSSATVLGGLLRIAFLALLWKIFPFVLRRHLRRDREAKKRRRYQIDYPQVRGSGRDLPPRFSAAQRLALAALAAKPEVWMDQTNLWDLFSLPNNPTDLRTLLDARA